MPLDAAQITSLVASPSLGAVTYQAASLRRQLARINDQEYLPEAWKIKEMWLTGKVSKGVSVTGWVSIVLRMWAKAHVTTPAGVEGKPRGLEIPLAVLRPCEIF